MGAVDRHTLRLVDGRGIAVIDRRVALEVDLDLAAVVKAHGERIATRFRAAYSEYRRTPFALV